MNKWWKGVAVAAALFAWGVPTAAQKLTGFEEYEERWNGRVMFLVPRGAQTSKFLEESPNEARITTERAHEGKKSLKVEFKLRPDQKNPWVNLTTFRNAEGAGVQHLPNPIISTKQPLSFWVYVPEGTPDFRLVLIIRETNPSGKIGEDGGFRGEMEFVGATGGEGADITRMPLGGKLIDKKGEWVKVTFDMTKDSIAAFTGNGRLPTNTDKVVLAGIGIVPVDSSKLGPYVLFLDDFVVEEAKSAEKSEEKKSEEKK